MSNEGIIVWLGGSEPTQLPQRSSRAVIPQFQLPALRAGDRLCKSEEKQLLIGIW